ncbi:MAG TPA: menaquinone biosynthesis protein [Saprospiraceae bacterium]|nr:menaquinone biosynthesis protein [Saprospiraceae bacterium]
MSYRIALVEYLNTYPFSEGIRLSGLEEKIEVHRVAPALCAQLFQERKVDISLCPVGALRDMPDHEICGKYCIGADGEVGTVVLLSQVPIDQIKKVRFDDQSRTSNLLLQILAKHHWKKEWTYYFDSNDELPESCLMIGDKVFRHKDQFAYSYDLAEEWKVMTALPMVFAVWITKPGIPADIINELDAAFELGMKSVKSENSTLEQWQKDYLLNCISYPLDEGKMEALTVFQSLIG